MKKRVIIGILLIVFAIIFLLLRIIPKGIGTGGISKEEFEKISIGIDNYKVNSIIDPDKTWLNEEIYKKCVEKINETTKDGKHSYTYKYLGEQSGYAIIKFEMSLDNYMELPKVVEKTQYNLK